MTEERAPAPAPRLADEPAAADTHTAKLLREWGVDGAVSRREVARRTETAGTPISRQTVDRLMRPRRPSEQRRVTRDTLAAIADALGKPLRPLQQAVIADWHPDQEVASGDGVSALIDQLRRLDKSQRQTVLAELLQIVAQDNRETE